MANINFKATSSGRKLARTPAKYRQSPGRPNVSQSAGVRPAFPMMPYEHLPLGFQDDSTQDYVVIPKGRIVSALTANSVLDAAYDDGNYYGVAKGIMGLMVPCNGDTAVRAVTSGKDASSVDLAINLPIGVVEHDVYQDINGDNLNYDMRNKNWGVLCHQLIKLPSIDLTKFDVLMNDPDLFGDTSAVAQDDFSVASGGYLECEKKFSFLTYSATLGADAGDMVAPDAFGNWVVTETNNAKVVGKIMGVDYRFNKDLLDTVQSKYDDDAAYRLTGTGTLGVPQYLYDFAYLAIGTALTKNSETWAAKSDWGYSAATAADPAKIVLTAIENAVFGEAWILVNI